jgi:hypothetical protein
MKIARAQFNFSVFSHFFLVQAVWETDCCFLNDAVKRHASKVAPQCRFIDLL